MLDPLAPIQKQSRFEARRIFEEHWAQFRDLKAAAAAAGVSERTGRRWRAEQKNEARARPQADAGPGRLIGRESDVAALEASLAGGDRLLTVFGPPGIGKTRLARQVCLNLRLNGHDAEFVDLTQSRTVGEAVAEVARALGVQELGSGQTAAREDTVATALSRRLDTFVVLDNLEQLTPAIVPTLSRWSERAPSARFVVTSRKALRVRSERLYELGALGLPGPDDGWENDAMALFLERAQAAEPSFVATSESEALVSKIVAHLQGIPLAIELAAGQMARTGPLELLEQLERDFLSLASPFHDSEARHVSLTAAIEGSWKLLSDVEKRALAQLSIFRGPFTEEAAAAVVDPVPKRSVSDILRCLRESSLLRVDPAVDADRRRRWEMFVAIREFVKRRAGGALTDALHARYADYWLLCGERWVVQSQRVDGVEARRLLSSHLRDLETAFRIHASRAPKNDALSRTALVIFEAVRRWMPRLALGPLSDALKSSRLEASPTAEMQARILTARGAVYRDLADYSLATKDFREARVLIPTDTATQASLDYEEGLMCHAQGRCDSARTALTRAVQIAEGCGTQCLEARARTLLARVLAEAFLDPDAFEHHARAVAILRRAGDPGDAAVSEMLWHAHRIFFQRHGASDEIAASVHRLREIGDHLHEAEAWTACGLVHQEAARLSEAEESYRETIRVAGRVGLRQVEIFGHLRLAMCLHERGDLKEARPNYTVAIEGFREIGDPRHTALANLFSAGHLAALGEHERAEERFQEAATLFSSQETTGFEALVPLQRALLNLCSGTGSPISPDLALANAVDSANLEIKKLRSPRKVGEHVVALPLSRTSPEARWLIRVTRGAIRRRGVLEVWSDGSRFRLHHADVVVVPDGPVLRRVLALLVETRSANASPVDTTTVLKRCWPGQRMRPEAGEKRVQESIRRLRRLGLDSILRTEDAGYALDRSVPVSVMEPGAADRTD